MRKTFTVTRDFNATTAVSGGLKALKCGDLISVDFDYAGDLLSIEAEIGPSFMLVAERHVLEICCKWEWMVPG